MKKVTTNKNQIEMDKIANDMAVLFEKKISASQLAKWLVLVNAHSDSNDDLVYELGYSLLPGLIECDTKDERIRFLKYSIPSTLVRHEFAHESLYQFGVDYLEKNKRLGNSVECVTEFMDTWLVLLSINDMHQSYESLEKEIKKDLEKAA